MQRKWLIPLTFCILLLLAWAFRWEHGPIQSDSTIKIVHLKDRWTGQAWISVYGNDNGTFYSGEMSPVSSQSKLEIRKAQILSSPVQMQKTQELKEKLNNAESTIKQYDWGHAKYYELAKLIAKQQAERYHDIPEYISDFSRYEKYEFGIPKDIIEAHVKWLQADKSKPNIKQELYNQSTQVEKQADSELKTWAWQLRDIASYIWGGLLAISLIATGVLFRNSSNTGRQPQNEHQID